MLAWELLRLPASTALQRNLKTLNPVTRTKSLLSRTYPRIRNVTSIISTQLTLARVQSLKSFAAPKMEEHMLFWSGSSQL